MTTGRIIDGAIFDADAEAARIVQTARSEASRLATEASADRARAAAELLAARHVAHVARIHDGAVSEAGHVTEVVGLAARAIVAGIRLGEVVAIDRDDATPLMAEVVGFRGDEAILLPLGPLVGVAPRSRVLRTGGPLTFPCSEALLGRIVDGLGQPMDGGPAIDGQPWAVKRDAPSAFTRPRITKPFVTGVRAVDGLCTLGEGQRIGVFAGAGVGKSTLLGQLAHGADVDVVVLCLVGERGRELGEMLSEHLASSRARTVAVCATSDAPSLVRVRAVETATAIAEWFREERGLRVLLLVDSLTRVARAQREVGLATGEPVARHGYPPSVFALLPRIIERAGSTPRGSITGIYNVLVAGGDLDEPIADEVRGLVDGHLVLERRLAARGHFPAIDVSHSVSRVMSEVTSPAHQAAAAKARRRIAVFDEHRDLITLGAYQAGSDVAVDDAVKNQPAIARFLTQGKPETSAWADTLAGVERIGK